MVSIVRSAIKCRVTLLTAAEHLLLLALYVVPIGVHGGERPTHTTFTKGYPSTQINTGDSGNWEFLCRLSTEGRFAGDRSCDLKPIKGKDKRGHISRGDLRVRR
jgi:hypothetical protein